MTTAYSGKHYFFQEEKVLINVVGVFILTTLFYFFGAMLRLVDELSLFWPLNGVMAGIFARYAFLNKPLYYFVCYLAMIVYDSVTTTWGLASLAVNFSNMIFIVLVARLLIRDQVRSKGTPRAINALNLFNYCLIGALFSALFGAVASIDIDDRNFLPLFADWFSEQFATGVLILPCMLTMKKPVFRERISADKIYPLIGVAVSLGASVMVGGAGSLAFPLPALIWCAVRFTLPASCLVTFLTGVIEIVLVANSIIEINSHATLITSQMFSARLGIATIAICPLIVSISVAAINKLMAQVSRRADYDYLTGVHSRSGLHEALKIMDENGNVPRQMSMMLLDIDYFKGINDNYGHECGDLVLAAFAAKVGQVVGDRGLVARMGGEEFAVFCPGADAEEGYIIAEQIRNAVAQHAFEWKKNRLWLTVSIGLGSKTRSWDSFTEAFGELMPHADRYLYISKNQGRNRTSAENVPSESLTQRAV